MNERSMGGGQGSELRGKVKWFNPEKGFGFVSPADGSPDVFLHVSALKQAGLQEARRLCARSGPDAKACRYCA
jgi:CspA family cold shock protein